MRGAKSALKTHHSATLQIIMHIVKWTQQNLMYFLLTGISVGGIFVLGAYIGPILSTAAVKLSGQNYSSIWPQN